MVELEPLSGLDMKALHLKLLASHLVLESLGIKGCNLSSKPARVPLDADKPA
jgi:hypothetical protein